MKENPALNANAGVNGQVNKSIRRMPWHWEPKKDVISCEKLRVLANTKIRRCPNGETYLEGKIQVSIYESIVYGRETGGTETSKYPQEKKEKSIL